MRKRILSLVLAVAMMCSITACELPLPSPPSSYDPTATSSTHTPMPTNTSPTPTVQTSYDRITPLQFLRPYQKISGVAGTEAFGTYWYTGKNTIRTDLSHSTALAFSLTFGDNTNFSALPAGYDPDALLEWGKYPGLNVDILHRYGFTGKGAVIAYVDQAVLPHEQYSKENVFITNNTSNLESMHGPAVLSLLTGKDIGTAPEATIHYYGFHPDASAQRNEAECLYQIIALNKTLPEDQKITMVGFSDNIDNSEAYVKEFQAAVKACEDAGIMVWFCGEYGAATFLPMSDKNDYHNVIAEHWWNTAYEPQLVYVPAAGRTTAATMSNTDYIYWSTGGLSWTMPYVLGLYSIAIEIDPTLTQDQLRQLIVSTAYVYNNMKIVNPVGFVAAVLTQAGRVEEAQMLLSEVASRQKYIYAVWNTLAITPEDLTAICNYLSTLTDANVLLVDAVYDSAEELYATLQADAAQRGGQVVGIQIFGTAEMVASFQVAYQVQMNGSVYDQGKFLTDLFYSNFNNDSAQISHGYNVKDHFAENWNVDLVPDWPVARLSLSRGQFTAFFEKYMQFVMDSGLERLDLVNFSNPIFNQTIHSDDMGTFLNRMNQEFGMLNSAYRLYGNLLGQSPVTTPVLGGFTAENLSKENDAGIVEFLINSHGQWNNIDKCYFSNGQEIRESLINMNTINSVLDSNAYYLDCWTCLNGYGLAGNLTSTALHGNCVGMFSASTVISNNGVDCTASVADMANSNFYYFYYSYLKALHEGASRSQAFFQAQREYATALIADSANGIDWAANYQFNLCNLLAYHNFGVLEPNLAVIAMTNYFGFTR